MTVYHHAVIPHLSRPEVLLLPGPEGWVLPGFVHPESVSQWKATACLNGAVRERFGVEVTTLRSLAVRELPDDQGVDFLYLLESHSPSWAPPPEARWFGRPELEDLPLAEPGHRAVLLEWFAWAAAEPVPPLRVPWYMPGWYAPALAWAREQLVRLGRPAAGPPVQVRSGQRSFLMRLLTPRGDVYFKAVPALFSHEVPLTQALAARYPAEVPAVLAADAERHWLILQDAGRTTFEELDDIARYERALCRYAEIQVAEAARAGELLALGCPDRRPHRLAAELDVLLADAPALRQGPFAFDDAELERLRALAPRLKDMCGALAGYRVPCSLEHGDLWVGNMIARGDGCVLVDWSDASLSHPFFSPWFFHEADDYFFQAVEAGKRLAALPDLRARLCRAYLEPWTAYEPMPRLQEALALAQDLAGLHYALLYHRLILPGMEIKWEMRNMLPYHLRRVLAHATM